MRREDVELSISVYAECDDGTGRVFVSARRETARELLRCTVSDCAKLRALCKRAVLVGSSLAHLFLSRLPAPSTAL